jgi:hypothetical protein
MTASASLHKRKTLLLVILFIAFTAFTADILDLREDLHIISCPYCPYSSLDNNITTGITSNVDFVLESVVLFCSVHWKSSVEISFLHLLPFGFRAPPSWS